MTHVYARRAMMRGALEGIATDEGTLSIGPNAFAALWNVIPVIAPIGSDSGPGSDEGYSPADPTATVAATTRSRTISSIEGSATSSAWLPDELYLNEYGALSAETIASSFDDPAQANTFFQTWGWQENSYAYYAASSGSSTSEGIVYVDIGVHRFADASGAAPALDYYCDVREAQMGLSEMAVAPIGDQSRAAQGLTSMGTEASVYVLVENAVIRVSVMSVGIDPMQPAITIAQSIMQSFG